jgi:hypothetical protein
VSRRALWALPLLAAGCYQPPLAQGFETGLSPKEGCLSGGRLTLVSAGPGDTTALVFAAADPNPSATPATASYEFTGGLTSYQLTAENGDTLTQGTCAGTATPRVFNAYSPVSGTVKLRVHAPGDATAYELSTVGVTLHLSGGSDTLPMGDITLAFPRSQMR